MKKVLHLLKHRWKLMAGALLIIATVGWWWTSAQQATPEQTFVTATRGDIAQTLTVSGRIDAKEKARLRFIAGGKVTYLNAQPGDKVTKGQTIAIIDRATLEKQLQQDLNMYMTERWNWEESLDDRRDRTIDTSERRTQDQEQWRLDNQVINVEIRDIAIRNTVLSAPFAGILTVSPTTTTGVQLLGSDYFEVVNPDSLVFLARVDESDIGLVKIGQPTRIVLDAFLDSTLDSFITYIAFTSNQQTTGTTFDIELPLSDMPNRDQFRLGMNGDATILLNEKKDVLKLPIITIRQREGKTFVQVKQADGTLEDREIQVGVESEDDIEVTGGLSETDEVLLPE